MSLLQYIFIDVIIRSNNDPVNVSALKSGLINDLDKGMNTKGSQSLFG